MTDNGSAMHWFGVRCIFQWEDTSSFEERITIWQARDFDAAVAMAEQDAAEHDAKTGSKYLDFAQVYVLPGPPVHGADVFSLARDSDLDSEDYLDAFFDTGAERDATLDEE